MSSRRYNNQANDITSKESPMTSNRSLIKSIKSGKTGKSVKSRNPTKKEQKKAKISALRGPFNLKSITMKDPKKLLVSIMQKMKEFGYTVKQIDTYTTYIRTEKQKFKIQINQLENFDNVFFVKFYKSNSDYDSYLKFCNQIHSLITF